MEKTDDRMFTEVEIAGATYQEPFTELGWTDAINGKDRNDALLVGNDKTEYNEGYDSFLTAVEKDRQYMESL